MRILYVTTVADTVRAFLLPFISHYRDLGSTVGVAAKGASASGLSEVSDRVYDLRWSRSLAAVPLSLLEGLRLRRIIVKARYDIVHVHTPIAAFCVRMSVARMPKPRPVVIYTAHGFHFHKGGKHLSNAFWSLAERIAGIWTDYLVVINKEDVELAGLKHIVPRDRVIYMPGIGVDTVGLTPDSVSQDAILRFRKALQLRPEEKLFLMSAEFISRKHHGDALRAFARLSDARCHLGFTGTGPLLEEIRLLAQHLGISGRVHFLGFRNDMPVCMRASAALLLPSEREGLPRSIMEAFCLGVPVIATNIRGSRELVEGNGILVPVGDVECLAAAMQRILSHPMEAAEMANRALEKVRKYDIGAIIRMHDVLYQQAMHDRQSQSSSAEGGLHGCDLQTKAGRVPRLARMAKRALEACAAASLLVALCPLLILVAVLIRLQMGNPVLFCQVRPGIDERPFTLLKFRTMNRVADAAGSLLPDCERLTGFGRLLRKMSVDELPQLWNVIKGDMSLVGPRPLLPEYLARYNTQQRRRHEVKPGITGWVQVNGRNSLTWEQKFDLDVWYVDHATFWLDVKILWMTLLQVLRRNGISQAGHATMPEFMGSESEQVSVLCSTTAAEREEKEEQNGERTVFSPYR